MCVCVRAPAYLCVSAYLLTVRVCACVCGSSCLNRPYKLFVGDTKLFVTACKALSFCKRHAIQLQKTLTAVVLACVDVGVYRWSWCTSGSKERGQSHFQGEACCTVSQSLLGHFPHVPKQQKVDVDVDCC